jgi:hypothetical protein
MCIYNFHTTYWAMRTSSLAQCGSFQPKIKRLLIFSGPDFMIVTVGSRNKIKFAISAESTCCCQTVN